MPLAPGYRRIERIHQRGIAADRPAIADVVEGTIYYSTDTQILERSNGTTWESYSDVVEVPLATEQTTTDTGTQNDFDLDARNTLLRCNNASLLTITGFTVMGATPQEGDIVTIVSVGAGNVAFSHQTGSTAANRLINYATSADTRLYAGRGTANFIYDSTTGRWRLLSHDQGSPIAQAYSAGDYTASGGGTWTVASGDLISYSYLLRGKILKVWWEWYLTSVSGSPAALQAVIAGGYTASGLGGALSQWGATLLSDNGTTGIGKSQVINTTTLYLYKDLVGTAWATSTDNTTLQGTFEFEVA